ncbi:MAG: hypothetical protein CFE45_26600 [Burkholderiales bacterium PBB5]|nr:MAG: hypothetical protein CFE45_26600 [Burkholderiales bacterium PBB5]
MIVKKEASLTEAEVRAFCEANLTGYKRPKVVEFRTDLPKTTVGKILRRELREARRCAISLPQSWPPASPRPKPAASRFAPRPFCSRALRATCCSSSTPHVPARGG